jgi:hypothetical protein
MKGIISPWQSLTLSLMVVNFLSLTDDQEVMGLVVSHKLSWKTVKLNQLESFDHIGVNTSSSYRLTLPVHQSHT